jgi:hypothetical protein
MMYGTPPLAEAIHARKQPFSVAFEPQFGFIGNSAEIDISS